MKRLIPILLATSSLALAQTPAAKPAASPPPAPAYGPAPAVPTYTPIKFGKLTVDVQEKMRFEIRDNNFDFDSAINGPQDASWLLQRFRLGLGYDVNPWLKFYIQGQDVRELGGSRPNNIGTFAAEGDDVFDILKAYVQLGNPKKGLSATIGRQFLNYGDQRLVGPLEWLNQARTFDAVKFRYTTQKYALDFFVSSPVAFSDYMWNQSGFLDNDESLNTYFSGLYFSTGFIPINTTTDFYVFHKRDDGDATFGPRRGKTDFLTFGTLWKGDPKKLGGFDYETEMAFQTGEVSGRNLSAYAGHWGVGYNWLKNSWKPRLGIQYNYGSGDGDPNDGDIGTFQNLYPTNHMFYGYMDTTAWMNMHNPQINLSFTPTAKLKVMLDYHLYWMANTADAWYRVNGATRVRPVNGASTSASSFRGQEIDLTAIYKLNSHVALQTGYSVFLPGDYLSDTGPHSTAHFGYFQVQIDF
ncbi:alginate export family protein [Prosthecobacter sp.]|uniref:alginate export family protein n=1 Tax=Prosthecobacter sp. TaxID=1965333 RepID=UPI002ABC9924|nr:alginate export family protein [Prosthecobacter sp.]MDZ4402602.1 alginate export family protein [Prosthecobacter sp.]